MSSDLKDLREKLARAAQVNEATIISNAKLLLLALLDISEEELEKDPELRELVEAILKR
jgi:predicted nucleic acid-binding protein